MNCCKSCNNCKYEFNYCIKCYKPLCECGPYEQEGDEGDFYCKKMFLFNILLWN